MMPLSMAKPGEESIIKKITAKGDVKQFLQSLGFSEGSSISVISEISGNMIVKVKDSRIAIDKAMANKVMI